MPTTPVYLLPFPLPSDPADVPLDMQKLADRLEVVFAAQQLADGSVTTVKLADKAVTTEKLADAAVTTPKLADNSVTGAKVVDGSLTGADIADRSLPGVKIVGGTIGSYEIADRSIIGYLDIAAGTVTPGELDRAYALAGGGVSRFQGGIFGIAGSAAVRVNFPQAFAGRPAVVTGFIDQTYPADICFPTGVDAGGFTFWNGTGGDRTATWIAVGP